MHKQLEDYLNEIAKSLGSLPATRREEELSEMRQHLLNAVVIGKEQGQSENEAILAAIEQFGSPQALGAQIVLAWRRERRLDVFKVLGIAIVTPIMLPSLVYSLNFVDPVINWLWLSNNAFLLHHKAAGVAFVSGLFYLVYGLTGTISGAALPKQAVRGVSLGMVVYNCCWFASLGRIPIPTEPRQFLGLAEHLAWTLTAVFCAWAVSRWRARGERRAQARLGG